MQNTFPRFFKTAPAGKNLHTVEFMESSIT